MSVAALTSAITTLSVSQNSPLAAFFNSFPGFTYDPTVNAATEYRRLRRSHSGVSREDFNAAFESEFNARFAGDEDSEWDWTRLCELLDIEPMPPSKSQARKVVRGINVNIYDLEHYDRLLESGCGDGAVLRRFTTVKELSKYSKKEKKIYPLEEAKEKGALKLMLRGLFRR